MVCEDSPGLSPCGLNCEWCVYKRVDRTIGPACDGCEHRECYIRSCEASKGGCEECDSYPCYHYLLGYQCVRQFQTY